MKFETINKEIDTEGSLSPTLRRNGLWHQMAMPVLAKPSLGGDWVDLLMIALKGSFVAIFFGNSYYVT